MLFYIEIVFDSAQSYFDVRYSLGENNSKMWIFVKIFTIKSSILLYFRHYTNSNSFCCSFRNLCHRKCMFHVHYLCKSSVKSLETKRPYKKFFQKNAYRLADKATSGFVCEFSSLIKVALHEILFLWGRENERIFKFTFKNPVLLYYHDLVIFNIFWFRAQK